MSVKIGYPDKWIDYSSLNITPYSYSSNYISAHYFNFTREIDKAGKPTNRSEWGIPPQTVNAYYNPLNNEIVFPAAILQPPFFNSEADDAINYGAMGVVIGHEITHGFDDEGKMFDGYGNLQNWWTDSDNKNFGYASGKIVKQFALYEPIKGHYINGNLTLGENIADLGGLVIAYNAFSKTDEYKGGENIDGFTPQQRFFLGFAQIWKGKIRDEALLMILKTNPHSPPRYRVNGSLVNLSSFMKAFNVKPEDKMYQIPDQIIVIW